VPEYPNPAFLNRLPDDEFWMDKQIVNLRDEELRAIVETGEYSDPRSSQWILKCLIERRDKIGRAAFAKVLPLDGFAVRQGRLEWEDLAAKHNLGNPLPVTVRWAVSDNERGAATPLVGADSPALPRMDGDGYWMAALESPSRSGQAVRIYLRKRGERTEVVGIERTWQTHAH
jgi:hypothetical protein